MGLFSSKPVEDVDPDIERAISSSTDRGHRQTMKLVGRCQGAVRSALDAEERILCAAHFSPVVGGPQLLIVTDQRSILFKKNGRIENQLRHSEVAETKLLTHPNGDILVEIISETSQLDYSPKDPERYSHIMMGAVETPRVANAVCATVDRHL